MTVSLAMASVVSNATALCPLSSSSSKFSFCTVSSSMISHPKIMQCRLSPLLCSLGSGLFLPWNGLKYLGISNKPKFLPLDRKAKCKSKVVYASLFGVGAPEALVIGVVALLVFGPKGLAEVARNLGKTLREFQPTIRELQEVSREFKSTLEREIGLDDIPSSAQNTYNSNISNTTSTPSSSSTAVSTDNSQTVVGPNGASGPNRAYSSEEYLKITEEQLQASVAQKEVQIPPPGNDQIQPPQIQPPTAEEIATTSPPSLQKPESET